MNRSGQWICSWLTSGLLLLSLLTGCTGTIKTPENLEEPSAFLLLDFGHHTSLLLPRAVPGRYVRYSYGDWGWYVEGREAWYRSLPVLLWPTAAGIGRAEFQQVASLDSLSYLAPQVYLLEAETEKILALQKRLDAYFDGSEILLTRSELRQLDFAPYPKNYWIFHQSNLKTAEWLRELGLDVRGYPLWSTWVVVEPPSD